MEASPPALPPPMSGDIAQGIRDGEHLRILGICHYVVGGFTALFASFFIIHIVMGLMVIGGAFSADRSPGHRPPVPHVATPEPSAAPFSPDRTDRLHSAQQEFPRAFGYFFVAIGTGLVLLGWTVGGLTIYAGRCLQRRQHRLFTLIMAGINCLQISFGTALGVFTFIVLQRPSVAALYLPRPAGRPLAVGV